MTLIREATNLDRDNIREVHYSAFPEGERQIVSTLAINLLNEKTSPATVSFLAETDDTVSGHIAFSPVTIDTNQDWKGFILAPLGVKLEFQNRQISSKLINNGMERLSAQGVDMLFVYGDPRYYCKFGFQAEAAFMYSPPYNLEFPFGWQAVVLNAAGISESTQNLSCVASLRDPKLW